MGAVRYPQLGNRRWLHRAYIHDNKSTCVIAAEIGCSDSAVLVALRRHNIPVRSRGGGRQHPLLDDADWLRDRYINGNVGCQQIGRLLGVSRNQVLNAVIRHGIPVHRQGSAPGQGRTPVKYPELKDREWLHREYVENRKPTTVIARSLGCSPKLVSKRLLEHGIPTRPFNGSSIAGTVEDEHEPVSVQEALTDVPGLERFPSGPIAGATYPIWPTRTGKHADPACPDLNTPARRRGNIAVPAGALGSFIRDAERLHCLPLQAVEHLAAVRTLVDLLTDFQRRVRQAQSADTADLIEAHNCSVTAASIFSTDPTHELDPYLIALDEAHRHLTRHTLTLLQQPPDHQIAIGALATELAPDKTTAQRWVTETTEIVVCGTKPHVTSPTATLDLFTQAGSGDSWVAIVPRWFERLDVPLNSLGPAEPADTHRLNVLAEHVSGLLLLTEATTVHDLAISDLREVLRPTDP